jgi:hypothetical protein
MKKKQSMPNAPSLERCFALEKYASASRKPNQESDQHFPAHKNSGQNGETGQWAVPEKSEKQAGACTT